MNLFTSSKKYVYNTVYDVPGGCILSLYIRDNAKAIRKANASLFKHQLKSLDYETSRFSIGPFICVWQRSDGSRYCKEVNNWPVDKNSNPIDLGYENNYGHILVSIIDGVHRISR